MANNIAVSITADVADLQVKRAIMSAELKAATKDLNTFAKEASSAGSTEGLREGMLAAASAAEKARASIAHVNVELAKSAAEARNAGHAAEEGGHGFVKMAHEVHEAAESVRTFQMRAKEFAEVYVAMFAVEKVVEFAKQMGEVAEKTKHTAEQFGMTVPEVQKLQGVATQTGIPIEALTRSFGIMDKNMVTSKGTTSAMANAFKSMGVSIDDGRTQMEKFAKISDKFKEMEDGPKKAALAMLLFGKSGKELIPVLNLGAEGIAEMNKRTQEYGGVSEDANAKGVALAESINESKLAFEGIGNVLTSALAPVLKEIVDSLNAVVLAFIKSYKEGGIVAVAFQIIKVAVQEVGAVIDALAGVFRGLWDSVSEIVSALVADLLDAFGIKTPGYFKSSEIALNLFKDTFIVLKDVIVILIQIIKGALIGLIDTLMTVGKIAHDAFTLNWGAIASDWQSGLDRLKSHALKTANDIKNAYADLATTIGNALQGKGPAVKEGGIPELKATGEGPDLGKTQKAKKAKKAKTEKGPSELELWKSDLADKLLLEKNWGVDEQAFSKAFWADKIKTVKAGSKEWLEIHRIMQAEEKSLGKEAQAASLATIKEQIAAEADAAKTTGEIAKLAIEGKIQAAEEELKAGRINAVELARIKRGLNAELHALDVDLLNQQYALQLAGFKAQLLVEHQKPAEIAKIHKEIELLTVRHETALTVAAAKGNKDRAKEDAAVLDAQRQRYSQMAKTFGTALGQMITMQKGFVATINGLWQSIVGGIAQSIARMTEQWILSLLVRDAASHSFHMKEVLRDAKGAAAGAWRAVVHIPVVGPFLAPVAAAAAFAGVMAFSAEGGMGAVPYDNAPFLLHKNEMVLPANLATPLRSMLTSPANSNAPMASNDTGDTGDHYHYHDGSGTMTPSTIMANRHAFAKAVRQAYREGAQAPK
jgi:hypothetical protein